jgi:hypothetical protein
MGRKRNLLGDEELSNTPVRVSYSHIEKDGLQQKTPLLFVCILHLRGHLEVRT